MIVNLKIMSARGRAPRRSGGAEDSPWYRRIHGRGDLEHRLRPADARDRRQRPPHLFAHRGERCGRRARLDETVALCVFKEGDPDRSGRSGSLYPGNHGAGRSRLSARKAPLRSLPGSFALQGLFSRLPLGFSRPGTEKAAKGGEKNGARRDRRNGLRVDAPADGAPVARIVGVLSAGWSVEGEVRARTSSGARIFL